MKFFGVLLFAIMFTTFSHAEIQIVEVANGKAVIKFDTEDNITSESKLVLKDLTLGATSAPPASELNCATCPEPANITSTPLIEREYKRTHFISGSITSVRQETKLKNSTSPEVKSSSVELKGSYIYNFGKFGLGGSIASLRETVDNKESITTEFGLGGRFFFVENNEKNNIVPFAGLEIAGASFEDSDTPKNESHLSGTSLDLGAYIFLNKMSYVEVAYSFRAAESELKQGNTIKEYEVIQGSLAFGLGVAFE